MGYLVKSASTARAIAAALKPVMKNLQKANISPKVRRLLRKEILANPQVRAMMQFKNVPSHMLNDDAIKLAINSALPGFGATKKPLLGWGSKLALGGLGLGAAGTLGATWGLGQAAYIPKALENKDADLLKKYQDNAYLFSVE